VSPKKSKTRAPLSDLLQEAELVIGLPLLKDSVDKDELPIDFILKRGRDRADAKAKARTPLKPLTKKK
jgi:hypothetical protein